MAQEKSQLRQDWERFGRGELSEEQSLALDALERAVTELRQGPGTLIELSRRTFEADSDGSTPAHRVEATRFHQATDVRLDYTNVFNYLDGQARMIVGGSLDNVTTAYAGFERARQSDSNDAPVTDN